jgi:hypothetical protein
MWVPKTMINLKMIIYIIKKHTRENWEHVGAYKIALGPHVLNSPVGLADVNKL